MMAKDLKVNTHKKDPTTSHQAQVTLVLALRIGQAWRGLVQSHHGHPICGLEGQTEGRLLHHPACPPHPTIIRLSVFSSLRPRSVSSLMPLYPYTYTLDHSAKMLAARGIYKAVARRGVHTTRVLASTKRK